MKIRTRGRQAFNVPNNAEGHIFLELLRKFRNRRWHYRARGRGPRKEHGTKYDIAQQQAEWLAVYLEREPGPESWHGVAKEWGQELANSALKTIGSPGPTFAAFHNVNLSDFEAEPSVPTPEAVQSAMTISAKVAEWSDPISAGDTVAIQRDGSVYNAYSHGISVADGLGSAQGNSTGNIGEGEGRVPVSTPEAPPRAPTAISPNPCTEIPIRQDQTQADEVELTPDEQEMLEKILEDLWDAEGAHWPYEKAEVLGRLINKLVD